MENKHQKHYVNKLNRKISFYHHKIKKIEKKRDLAVKKITKITNK